MKTALLLLIGMTFSLYAESLAQTPSQQGPDSFESDWPISITRTWIGPDYWANRLQDWQIRAGRLECVEDDPQKPMRTVHLLTHELSERVAGFEVSVRTGMLGYPSEASGDSWSGFLVGAGAGALDYRAAALIHHNPGEGGGIIAGIDDTGRLIFRSNQSEAEGPVYEDLGGAWDGRVVDRQGNRANWEDLELILTAIPDEAGAFTLVLEAKDVYTGRSLSRISLTGVAPRLVQGNLALVSHGGDQGKRYWFREWRVSGEKVDAFPDRTFGPVLNAFFSLNAQVLKMTAQFPPLGFGDAQEAQLFVKEEFGSAWLLADQTTVVTPGYTAHFRVEDWDDEREQAYRIRYVLNGKELFYEGKIPRNPTDKSEIVVAGINCYQVMGRPADGSWGEGFAGSEAGRWTPGNVWFPHTEVMDTLPEHKVDLLAFLGDQVYEGGNPTTSDHREGYPELDYLYKWYIFLWDVHQVTRMVPTVVLTDDHDVYQGDLWGDGGSPSPEGSNKAGGYVHEPAFVNLAQRTQTSHNPDAYDPTPVKQGIEVYYGAFTYGGINFAILEDRKFKSLPTVLPDVEKNGSKIITPNYDPSRADVEGLFLLGERQMSFLKEWVAEGGNTTMRIAFSQTLFASLHTDPTGEKWIDIDSNGWPQSARNRTLEVLRKGRVFLLSGDTHLPAVVQHGIASHGDAGYQFVAPALANKYRRWWTPAVPGKNRPAGAPEYTGDHTDGLGNLVTVKAVGNPLISNEEVYAENIERGKGYASEHLYLNPLNTRDGYAILRLDKERQTITMEAWPPGSDPENETHQHPGWPLTISVSDNGGN